MPVRGRDRTRLTGRLVSSSGDIVGDQVGSAGKYLRPDLADRADFMPLRRSLGAFSTVLTTYAAFRRYI